ncbi:MAG: low molecular weight protein arginine phosphatase [Planctomycetes bacterium]|nr:low molecular weight protein arginine phosphatase [Planctomycetota bacterium]
MKVLCVCTGNTCRSPMLMTLIASACAKASRTGVVVESAGTSAVAGEAASGGAIRAMRRRGLSLDAHRSRGVQSLSVSDFDRVLCMSSNHAAYMRSLGIPASKLEVVNAEAGGVPDPFGGPDSAYEQTAAALESFAQEFCSRAHPVDPGAQ